jgi:hypothetical protein|tara:strand:+ start:147 stop:533 length:387 start_codon:yes stop_codon:yes gene_type:complete
MNQDKIQSIIDYAYPKIQKYFGKGKKDYPNIELHKDIYARLSGDEEAKGEHSSTSIAEYDENENKIFIYYPNVNNEEDVLKALIHEYTHYTQDSKLLKRYRSIYSYNEDPFELEATKAENKWQLFSKK